MTEHPLTDEKCMSLFSFGRLMDESRSITVEDSMRAAADWQLDQVMNAWEDAFQSDLEHGVRSLNDKAAKELAAKYPKIFAFGEVLASMRPTQQENN
jgi:hypothetical protein